jgi:hypothetical protein
MVSYLVSSWSEGVGEQVMMLCTDSSTVTHPQEVVGRTSASSSLGAACFDPPLHACAEVLVWRTALGP